MGSNNNNNNNNQINNKIPINNKNISPNIIKYTQYVTTSTCFIAPTLLCQASGEDNCGNKLQISPQLTNSLLLKNGTDSIFSLYISVQIGVYNYTINSVYNLYFECLEFNISSIKSFKLINKYIKQFSTEHYYDFVGFFEMEGFEYNNKSDYFIKMQDAIFPDLPGSVLSYMYGNYCYMKTTGIPLGYSLNSPVNLQINTQSTSKSFLLDPFLEKVVYSQIIEYKTYPNLNSQIDLFGYDQTAIISITLNCSINDIVYSITANGSNFYNTYYPIYGGINNTTFLVPLNQISDSFVEYEIYFQNNSKFSNYLKFNTTINQFAFSKPQIPSNLEMNGYYNSLPIINYGFIGTDFSISPLEIYIDSVSTFFNIPYGFSYGSSKSYIFNVSSIVNPYGLNTIISNSLEISSPFDQSKAKSFYFSLENFSYNSSLSPSVLDYEIIHLFNEQVLIRANISAPYTFAHIKSYSKYFGNEIRVSGSSTMGVYEFVLEASNGISFQIYDIYGGKAIFSTGFYTSINPLKLFKNPPQLTYNFDIFSIQNVSFLFNEIDFTLSSQRCYNVLYFNYSSQVPRDTMFTMKTININDYQNIIQPLTFPSFYSKWNDSIEMFQIEFYIDSIPSGDFVFYLQYDINAVYYIFLDTILKIKNPNLDLQGPVFKNLNKYTSTLDDSNNIAEVGWAGFIQDEINGFDSGYITIIGELDLSIYNLTFTFNDAKMADFNLGQYEFKFNISYPCITQNYTITEVKLVDRLNRVSYFSVYPQSNNKEFASVINPFINHIGLNDFNKILVTCIPDPIKSLDTTPPDLTQFSISHSLIDVSKTNRELSFSFNATDLESGIKKDQSPVVYVNVMGPITLQCKSKMVYYNFTSASYTCTIQLPLSFGYPNGGIIVSVYGFINNNGLFRGYSFNNLVEKGFTAYIPTTYGTNEPYLLSYSRISEKGGDLWIFGKGFASDAQAFITFSNLSTSVINATKVNFGSVLFKVGSTNKPYQLYIKTNSFISNNLTITPTFFGINQVAQTPIPTNSPQPCPGNPICGGPSNGYCVQNQGCVCISPWIGIDCLSQIVIIDQPTVNNTNPTTEINLPTNGTNTPISYHSLISLVSLREININGEQVINSPFDKWIVRALDNTTFLYFTSLAIDNGNGNKIVTNVTVTLKWFINDSTIIFANEQLLMHASTMKYTIEISNYPFSNRLNQLQLIMSAFIQSDKSNKDICSLKEFGETSSGDNSNYLKIQVDNHSLYGRFIKRGIIDSVITSVSNILLDSDFKSINNPSTIQSYIGIQIPYYTKSIILDPDFSILVDSYSASSKSGSNCNNSSKLSTGKIIGIVLGCVAFVSIIIIIISYHIIKRKNEKKFFKNVNQKMSAINNGKI